MSNTFGQGSFNKGDNDGNNILVVLQDGQVAHFEGEDGFLRCKEGFSDGTTEVKHLLTESGERIRCNPGAEPPIPPTPPGSLSDFGMFYGLTAGTGNGGATDYAATVAVKTVPGSGRVPFPRNGPAVGVVRIDDSSFTLADIGTYEVNFGVHTTEPGQLQLELNGTALPETTAANMNPTAGGHPIGHSVLITTVAPNAILAVINPAGNSTALTITPADGASTNANSQVLTIKKIA